MGKAVVTEATHDGKRISREGVYGLLAHMHNYMAYSHREGSVAPPCNLFVRTADLSYAFMPDGFYFGDWMNTLGALGLYEAPEHEQAKRIQGLIAQFLPEFMAWLAGASLDWEEDAPPPVSRYGKERGNSMGPGGPYSSRDL